MVTKAISMPSHLGKDEKDPWYWRSRTHEAPDNAGVPLLLTQSGQGAPDRELEKQEAANRRDYGLDEGHLHVQLVVLRRNDEPVSTEAIVGCYNVGHHSTTKGAGLPVVSTCSRR